MKRFDKGYIYANLLSDFFSLLVLTGIFADDMVIKDDGSGTVVDFAAIPYVLLLFALFFLSFILYRIFFYRTSGYELTDRELRCKRGVLFRKKSVLDYQKIHAINKKQTLCQRIFGVAVLTVDSGATSSSYQAEIILVEKVQVVDALLDELHRLREGGTRSADAESAETVLLSKNDNLYRFTSKKKLVYTAVTIGTTALATLLIGVLLAIVLGVCRSLWQFEPIKTLSGYLLWSALTLVGAVLLFSFFSLVGSLIHAFIGYHNFTITKRDADLEISFGLFERHTNTFRYNNIKAVKICQSFVQRLFGFATIKLEVIGYTNETGKEALELGVLVPFCKFSEIDQLLTAILPDYVPDEKATSAPAFFPFISWYSLFLGVSILAASLLAAAVLLFYGTFALLFPTISVIWCIGLLLFLIKVWDAFLNYKTSGLGFGKNKITAYSGGLSKVITVFKTQNLIAVESSATPLRRKASIATLILHLKTNFLSNTVCVPLQHDRLTNDLESMMTV